MESIFTFNQEKLKKNILISPGRTDLITIPYAIPLLFFIYLSIQLTLRVLIQPGLNLDEAEQMILTQSFELGYNAQPPLYTWLQMLFFQIFGKNLLALSILKSCLLFFTYFFTYRAAQSITSNHLLANMAAAATFFLPQISWESQRALSHSVLATTISACTLYLILRLRNRKKATNGDYLLLGAVAGLGLLAKYNYAIFLSAVFLTCLIDRKLNRFFRNPKTALSIIALMAVVAPHSIWLFQNAEMICSSLNDKLNPAPSPFEIRGLFSFLRAVAGFAGPMILVVLCLFKRSMIKKPDETVRNYIFIATILLVLFTLFTGTTKFKDRWMQPIYLPVALLMVSMIDPDRITAQMKRRFIFTVYTTMIITILLLSGRFLMPDLMKNPPRSSYPFKEIAMEIDRLNIHPDLLITESNFIGGNLKPFFPALTVITPDYAPELPNAKNVLVVWEEDPPDWIKENSSSVKQLFSIAKPFPKSHKVYQLHFARASVIDEHRASVLAAKPNIVHIENQF